MLCLGSAMVGEGTSAPFAGSDKSLPSRLLMLGAVIAMTYVLTDVRMHSAMEQRNPEAVAAAAEWVPWDPVAANTVASAYVNFDGRQPALEEALKWMERARERRPDFPFYSNKIAQLNLMLGDTEAARGAIETALLLQPWNVQSLQLLEALGEFTHDDALATRARTRLCTLGADFCSAD
jgi:hypothetical protein